jgi:hypothetical protein
MVQLNEPLRDQERIVIGQARYARTKLDVLGAIGGDADEYFR